MEREIIKSSRMKGWWKNLKSSRTLNPPLNKHADVYLPKECFQQLPISGKSRANISLITSDLEWCTRRKNRSLNNAKKKAFLTWWWKCFSELNKFEIFNITPDFFHSKVASCYEKMQQTIFFASAAFSPFQQQTWQWTRAGAQWKMRWK